jgi:hypothetical protein
MGRTNPTFRGVLQSLQDRWGDYRRALRYEDEDHFDAMFEYAHQYADAAGYLNVDTPMLAVLLSIALGQEKRRAALAARVEALEARVADLEAGSEDGDAAAAGAADDGPGTDHGTGRLADGDDCSDPSTGAETE